MIEVLLILSMAILSRMSGGGLGADTFLTGKISEKIPEMYFGFFFGLAIFVSGENWWLSTLASAWSFAWMETGHGTAYTMGRNPLIASARKPSTGKRRTQTLSKVVDPICLRLGWPIGGTAYSWLFMGLKGFLIGLPIFPFGLALGVLWPLSYEARYRLIGAFPALRHLEPSEVGEWLSGASAGLVLAFYLSF